MSQKKPSGKFSLVYAIMKPAVRWAAHLFYRRYTITGREHFPKDVPVMLVSNHQNAMMDAIMCCAMAPKQLHFLTRADIFKAPVANKILRHLNMLPVYRPRDGRQKVATLNTITFEESERRLAAGNVISAFPEGNHSNKRAIRPLKKGVARIALRAMKNYDLETMFVLPVGLDYSDYESFRADLMIRCGEPIDLKPYREQMDQDETMAINNLTAHIAASLRELVIDIRRVEFHDTFMFLRSMIVGRKEHTSHLNEIKFFQQSLDSLSDAPEEQLSELKSAVDEFSAGAGSESEQLLGMSRKVGGLKWMFMLLFSPVIILGTVLNLLPALFVAATVQKMVKDPHFKSSIKIGMSIFVFPLYWLLVSILVWVFCPQPYAMLMTLIGLPISGIFAVKGLDYLSDISASRKIKEMDQSGKDQLLRLKNRINKLLDNILDA